MKKSLILATTNKGKTKEIQKYLQPLGFEIKSLLDFDTIDQIIEDGTTFAQNAHKKALTVYKILNQETLADDSGLCVSALNGKPGIFSARYGGSDLNDLQRCHLLLKELEDVRAEQRTAWFECALVYIESPSKINIFNGRLNGTIGYEPLGENGFGYDPIFIPSGFDKTLAQFTLSEKKAMSHRSLALKKFIAYLNDK